MVREKFLQAARATLVSLISVSLEVSAALLPSDVLLPQSRGLNHLVNGAVALGEELVGEAEGDIVNNLGLLKRQQRLVVASRRKQAVGRWKRNGSYGKHGKNLFHPVAFFPSSPSSFIAYPLLFSGSLASCLPFSRYSAAALTVGKPSMAVSSNGSRLVPQRADSQEIRIA